MRRITTQAGGEMEFVPDPGLTHRDRWWKTTMLDFDLSRMIQQLILVVPGFLLAITVHEFAHGYVALRLGDPTAKMAGRLTFNPISHIDPIGAVVLVVTQLIGWAKPVPVDPRYLRNPTSDMMWISLAGPAANLIAATALAVVLHAIVFAFSGRPLGSAGLFVLRPLAGIIGAAVSINVMLAVFNMVPIPPLDGSKILAGLLPRDLAYKFENLEQYGFIILVLLLFTGVINYLIFPPYRLISSLLLGGIG